MHFGISCLAHTIHTSICFHRILHLHYMHKKKKKKLEVIFDLRNFRCMSVHSANGYPDLQG